MNNKKQSKKKRRPTRPELKAQIKRLRQAVIYYQQRAVDYDCDRYIAQPYT
jgi:hypothetical protein